MSFYLSSRVPYLFERCQGREKERKKERKKERESDLKQERERKREKESKPASCQFPKPEQVKSSGTTTAATGNKN